MQSKSRIGMMTMALGLGLGMGGSLGGASIIGRPFPSLYTHASRGGYKGSVGAAEKRKAKKSARKSKKIARKK